MEWVLIFSILWVVNGTPTTPTTDFNIGYENETICKKAAETVRKEMAISSGAVQVHVQATCVQKRETGGRGTRNRPAREN